MIKKIINKAKSFLKIVRAKSFSEAVKKEREKLAYHRKHTFPILSEIIEDMSGIATLLCIPFYLTGFFLHALMFLLFCQTIKLFLALYIIWFCE